MRRSELARAERDFVDLENAVLEIGDTRVGGLYAMLAGTAR